MNMLSPTPRGTEFPLLSRNDHPKRVAAVAEPEVARSRHVSRVLWPVAVLGIGYALTTASATTLWIVAGICAALVAVATAVCLYALDHTIDLY